MSCSTSMNCLAIIFKRCKPCWTHTHIQKGLPLVHIPLKLGITWKRFLQQLRHTIIRSVLDISHSLITLFKRNIFSIAIRIPSPFVRDNFVMLLPWQCCLKLYILLGLLLQSLFRKLSFRLSKVLSVHVL